MITGAVVVTYNPLISDLTILIKNIIETVKTVVIVDNGSKNINEVQNFIERYKSIHLMLLGENKGIGFAQNRGIEKVFSDEAVQGVVIFDHDSHPEPDMIQVLASEYERLVREGVKVGALGPVYVDPRTQNNYPISVFSGFSLKKKYPVAGISTPIPASFIIASGSLIPRGTYQDVGGMNEAFFIDYIDIEWGFRVQSKGYHLFACPFAKMYHQVGDSRLKVLGREISIHSPLRRYYLARNSVFMLKTNYINWRYKVREFFYSISRVFIFVALVDKKRTYLRYILRGWYDGLSGKTGPCTIV